MESFTIITPMESGLSPPALACFACREAHTACSKERPCKRCAALGKACFDPVKKKRGRPKKSDRASQHQLQRGPASPLQHKRARLGTIVCRFIRERDVILIIPPKKEDNPPPLPAGVGSYDGAAKDAPVRVLPGLVSLDELRARLSTTGATEGAVPRYKPNGHRMPSDAPPVLLPQQNNAHNSEKSHSRHDGESSSREDGISSRLLLILIEQLKDMKKDIRDLRRRQETTESLVREMNEKIDAVPPTVISAVASAISTSHSSTSPSSQSPYCTSSSPISPMPVISSQPRPVDGMIIPTEVTLKPDSDPDYPTYHTSYPGFPSPPPRQVIAAMFPFLEEYKLGTSHRPFACTNPGKPIIILRMIPHGVPGEESVPPLIVYANDAFCSSLGYNRGELVGFPVSKIAMPDYAFKEESSKRFLSPTDSLIGDVWELPMLVMKRNGIPARAKTRFQFLYNERRRQRWLVTECDGLDEGNIVFNPAMIVQPAVWYRSHLMDEQRARLAEEACLMPSISLFQTRYHAGALVTTPYCSLERVDTESSSSGNEDSPGVAPASGGVTHPIPTPVQPPSDARRNSQQMEESISDLLASIGGAPSPNPFPASPLSSFPTFY